MKKALIGRCVSFRTTIWYGDYEIEFPDEFECVEDYIEYLRKNEEEAYDELYEELMDLDLTKDKTTDDETILFFKDIDGDNLRYEEE